METAEELYKYWLSLIRKERTTIVKPAQWVTIMNAGAIDWVKTKLPQTEFVQKRIDDLEAIHVLTDGVQEDMIESDEATGAFMIPSRYLYGLSASFGYYHTSIDEIPEEDEPPMDRSLIGSDSSRMKYIVGGKILRSDNRVFLSKNPYRKPDDETIYFELRSGKVYLKTDGSPYNRMIMEYYRFPDTFSYGTGDDATGSFNASQNKEIVDLTARKFLERMKDPRYQSYVAEQMSTPQ